MKAPNPIEREVPKATCGLVRGIVEPNLGGGELRQEGKYKPDTLLFITADGRGNVVDRGKSRHQRKRSDLVSGISQRRQNVNVRADRPGSQVGQDRNRGPLVARGIRPRTLKVLDRQGGDAEFRNAGSKRRIAE